MKGFTKFKVKSKQFLALSLGTVCMFTAVGCRQSDTSNTNDASAIAAQLAEQARIAQESQQNDQSSQLNTVDFGLQSPPTTSFDDVPLENSAAVDGLYTILNGYAYALDPNTFEPVGPPLDVNTHQPIPQEPEPEVVEEPAPPPVVEIVEPTEETKLPNTGIFLEDD